MTHLFGIPINEKVVLWKALKDIPGVGKSTALKVCANLGLLPESSWEVLQERDKRRLQSFIIKEIASFQALGTEYLRQRRQQRKELISLGSYRGIRRRIGLPARGQKTRSNARTARKLKY